MGPFLLDVNVLLSLLWPKHVLHQTALQWFVKFSQAGWATCPITESGFLRVVCNPAMTPRVPEFQEAFEVLIESKRANPTHVFWPHATPVEHLPNSLISRIVHRDLLTDAHLLALAVQHAGKLVTFDRRMIRIAPEGSPERKALVILETGPKSLSA